MLQGATSGLPAVDSQGSFLGASSTFSICFQLLHQTDAEFHLVRHRAWVGLTWPPIPQVTGLGRMSQVSARHHTRKEPLELRPTPQPALALHPGTGLLPWLALAFHTGRHWSHVPAPGPMPWPALHLYTGPLSWQWPCIPASTGPLPWHWALHPGRHWPLISAPALQPSRHCPHALALRHAPRLALAP